MEYRIRPWRKDDVPALTGLWSSVFGDTEAFAEMFLNALPRLGNGFVADYNGLAVSAAYVITDIRADTGTSSELCAYLYGVATLPNHRERGLAAALCAECLRYSRELGCEIFYTQPAEAALFPYYANSVGTNLTFFGRTCREAAAADKKKHSVSALTAGQYFSAREQFYKGNPHIVLSEDCIDFEKQLCRLNDGDLFLVDSVPVAAYVENDFLKISEMLCEKADISHIASALCDYVNQNCYQIRLSDSSGEPFIACTAHSLPENFYWGITFD